MSTPLSPDRPHVSGSPAAAPATHPSASRPRWPWWLAGLLGAALLVGLALWLSNWLSQPEAPRRQVARIALLPDAPPPPPPPPPKEPPPQAAKPEARPQAQPEPTPRPPQPADAPLKMEGAAGDGPSAFQAGSVAQDYRGGPATIGGTAASGAGRGIDRAAERLYAGTVRQLLRDEMERQLPSEAGELSAGFALWVSPDGRITRWELEDAPAESARAQALRDALGRSAGLLQLPQPPGPMQAMRFRLTVRANG